MEHLDLDAELRQLLEDEKQKNPDSSSKEAYIRMHFKGDTFLELSNDIENDLNFNNYTRKEIPEKRQEVQSLLEAFMESIDRNEILVVSTEHATSSFDGEMMILEERDVFYDQTTVVKDGSFWRVAHGFTVINYDGTRKYQPVHILSENLRDIRRKKE